jgi:D-alanyl-lipoteichoic acid acyltransferase DltB (MBOAT superfamily)
MIRQKPLPENLKNRSAYTQAEETHHSPEDYGIAQFFAYTYYLPLFLAGPVVTFNAFLAQVDILYFLALIIEG